MIIDEVVDFLRNNPPFQFLSITTLYEIASSATVEFYSKGTLILRQDGLPSEYLRVIKKGGVKIYIISEKGDEIIIDYRSEGDSFGLLSVIGGDKSRANVLSVEDTICYLIDKKTIRKLIDNNPYVTEFFFKSFLNTYIDKTFKEMHDRSLLYGGGDKLLFTTPLGEIASPNVITAPQSITIREAAEIMSKGRISALVLLDADEVPIGIVTDRDLRDKVVAKGRDVAEPINRIMSMSLIKSDMRDYCYEALLKMVRYNIHHMLVLDDGKLKGIVSNHDLMMLQGTSPISVAREIESQQTLEGLRGVSRKTDRIVELLLKDGAKASNITKIITEINDLLVKKLLWISEKTIGQPPVPYCWIAMGSEGRKEQTFKTDQDNAIIYDDPVSHEEGVIARDYFEKFSLFMKEALIKCGFPVCPGDYMAANPLWRKPLTSWKEAFAGWIKTPTSEAILLSSILFDFRPVYGDFTLAERLRAYVVQLTGNEDMFLRQLAGMAVKLTPPLGFFRTFVVEKSGEHKNELNLKFKCIAPIVDIARLYSLEKGISEVSTLDRLYLIRGRHTAIDELCDDLGNAFEFLNLLRIHHQFDRIAAGLEPDNFINPDKLSILQKRTFKEVCRIISRAQDSIVKQYFPGTTL
jgi:CBS domain-containing protein